MAEPTGLDPATSDVTGEKPDSAKSIVTSGVNKLPRHRPTRSDINSHVSTASSDTPTDTGWQAINLALAALSFWSVTVKYNSTADFEFPYCKNSQPQQAFG